MKLPFIILNRVTYDKLIENQTKLQQLDKYHKQAIDELHASALALQEENRNLRYNYENLKEKLKDIHFTIQ